MRPTQGPACGAGRIFQVAQGGLFCLLLGAAVLSARHCGADESSHAPGRSLGYPSATPADPARLLRLALEAEAGGDSVGRERYLAQALAADPDYTPAHWQLGEVRQNGSWMNAHELPRDAYFRDRLKEYRRKVDGARRTFDAQLSLARFCHSADLQDQERLHYGVAFLLNPTSSEAREHLQLVDFHGRPVLPIQATLLVEQERLLDVTTREWGPRIQMLCQAINGDETTASKSAIRELSSIRDPDAIPALEAASRTNTGAVGEAVVTSLSQIRGQAATDSLVRHAVLAQDNWVRRAAIKGLRPRSLYATVPALLNYMQMPVQVRYETFFLASRPAHRLTLYQEGVDRDLKFVSRGAMGKDVSITGRTGAMQVRINPDPTLTRDRALAEEMEQFNATQAEVNERTVAALRDTTGEDLPNVPRKWWEWWANYNEMYRPTERPVSYLQQTAYAPVQVRYHSCFVPGTRVWTIAGPTRIEETQVGELVLSQNVETGELAYKPVLGTTVGPKVRDLVEIRAGGELIRATYGHLFWVAGVGWKMAKELEPGQLLHTTHGPIVIDNVNQEGAAVCHNLIVADFNTYFVTDQAFLVHDINVRGPTNATVPGLVDEDENLEAPAQP
jgi:hypothetical protein